MISENNCSLAVNDNVSSLTELIDSVVCEKQSSSSTLFYIVFCIAVSAFLMIFVAASLVLKRQAILLDFTFSDFY